MGFSPSSHWLFERMRGATDRLDQTVNGGSRRPTILIAALSTATLVLFVGWEMKSSRVQSQLLAFTAAQLKYSVKPGLSTSIIYPAAAPYDQRLGYADLPRFQQRLVSRGFEITAQARNGAWAARLRNLGLFPIYREKSQAGLTIVDAQGRSMYEFRDPRRAYPAFGAVPPLVLRTLLFIENRSLLNPAEPYRNPAIEWDRLARAGADYTMHGLNRSHAVIGGSTLATQLEKLRHSPEGRTHTPLDKVRQIASASLRIYQDGPRTLEAQRRVALDYINSIPLSAAPRWGEVSGLADGLAVWYGADFERVNQLLAGPDRPDNPAAIEEWGVAYRQVLSLFLALRQPSRLLGNDADVLRQQTDSYIRALASESLLAPWMRDAALAASIHPQVNDSATPARHFVANKAADTIRANLLTTLGIPDSYALDRLDLTAKTTLDHEAQQAVTRFLSGLSDPEKAKQAGLIGHQLLSQGDPAKVTYAFTLYERGNGQNLLRIQADNFNQPLNINEGTKLQLGSTAKLRTLIVYLEVIEQLHRKYSVMTSEQLNSVKPMPGDRLTRWALEYFTSAEDRGLAAMLSAALDRQYSGSPRELFFTAGGLHTFANFEREEDFQKYTVGNGFEHSVNLVFIRLMRDVAGYYAWNAPGASREALTNPRDPARAAYLKRFADREGSVFLGRFYTKYRGKTAAEAVETLIAGIKPTSLRLAVVHRSVWPRASVADFSDFLRRHLPNAVYKKGQLQGLYDDYAMDKFSLADRGYLARLHPLELWMLSYRASHPKATFAESLAASTAERQAVYRWLFRPRLKEAQDKRIRIIMEEDAFAEIGKAWKRLGYPFERLVPSYATSLGASGDTPKALADLAGILINNGMRQPALTVRELHFGEGTPVETLLAARTPPGVRVLHPEIAALVRARMTGVVEKGTGRRAFHAFTRPDGTFIPLAGKTGTGDNRFKVFASAGRLTSERVVNRTATFVFLIGDRFYGTVTAFVPGEAAGDFRFTSALAVQVLKDLAPDLGPLIAADPASADKFTLTTQVR